MWSAELFKIQLFWAVVARSDAAEAVQQKEAGVKTLSEALRMWRGWI
jgi:hypothetical protein